jgi:hypothetical protein
MAPVLANLTPSSSKKALLEMMTDMTVTPPLPTCGGFTVTVMVAVWVRAPLVPVTVTVATPKVAVLEAESVRVLVPVVEAGLNAAVTPLGSPVAVKATLPLKPPDGVTVMVLVAVDPWLTVILAEAAVSEKSPPMPVTVRGTTTV